MLRKEAGMDEHSVLKFLECVMTLLDLIMDANCSVNEVPIFNYDQVKYFSYLLIFFSFFVSINKCCGEI